MLRPVTSCWNRIRTRGQQGFASARGVKRSAVFFAPSWLQRASHLCTSAGWNSVSGEGPGDDFVVIHNAWWRPLGHERFWVFGPGGHD